MDCLYVCEEQDFLVNKHEKRERGLIRAEGGGRRRGLKKYRISFRPTTTQLFFVV